MAFGISPSDVLKLLEMSTRVYIAFKDANDNSEAQVAGLVREFNTFHKCLIQLDELMKEFGKPLPFPCEDFRETLLKCEKSIKPYTENLVDRKINVKKVIYTIKYIGKEKEIDGLRRQISGHCQALQMCISFLNLRLHLEATKQTQRLLDTTPFRSMSLGGQWYTSNALGGASQPALPAPSDADALYKDWVVFSRWLKTEDDRIAQEAGLVRPLSLGDTPAAAASGDPQTAAVLYHLRRELEDAIVIEENRAKRTAVEKRTHLGPSDAVRREVQNLPQVPQRTYTLDTDHSGEFSRFQPGFDLSESAATIRASQKTPSPLSSPTQADIEKTYFDTDHWSPSISIQSSHHHGRKSSMSTHRSSISTSPGARLSVDNNTLGTTPEEPSLAHPLRSVLSAASLATIFLGEGALEWIKLCRKVQVERTTSSGVDSRQCDIHWRYREDAGISIRSVYRSSTTNEAKVWTMQNFPATGPSIPLTTSYPDGDVSIDFPRRSFGRLEKRCTDIKYTFSGHEASLKLQTLLYTNNGKDAAELLFDRPVSIVSSNLNKPECRNKNIRLWHKTEEYEQLDGVQVADVLVLLFYTSALPDEKGHWVEEPHYAFQWLPEDKTKKSSDKITLTFSKEPGRWRRDKTFSRRGSSASTTTTTVTTAPLPTPRSARRDSTQHPQSPTTNSPQIPPLLRSGTRSSVASASSAVSLASMQSGFGLGAAAAKNRVGDLNRFGYSKLEIEFQNKADRRDFVEIWGKFVKPQGVAVEDGGS